MDDVYVEKAISHKWFPDLKLLAIEKCKGRNRVSFEHVKQTRMEIGFTYFGNVLIGKMVCITDNSAAQQQKPVLMRLTVAAELKDYIPLDVTYKEEKTVKDYESDQIENQHLQLIIEDKMETMLDNHGYIFADDGKSFQTFCTECELIPCVWAHNRESMINYDQAAVNEEDTEANKCRHGLYHQIALLINGGPSGHGNRLKLPQCIVTGVQELLFPNPGAYYFGHRELE
jgi:hypothetical protein